jgi:hypothetical protein
MLGGWSCCAVAFLLFIFCRVYLPGGTLWCLSQTLPNSSKTCAAMFAASNSEHCSFASLVRSLPCTSHNRASFIHSVSQIILTHHCVPLSVRLLCISPLLLLSSLQHNSSSLSTTATAGTSSGSTSFQQTLQPARAALHVTPAVKNSSSKPTSRAAAAAFAATNGRHSSSRDAAASSLPPAGRGLDRQASLAAAVARPFSHPPSAAGTTAVNAAAAAAAARAGSKKPSFESLDYEIAENTVYRTDTASLTDLDHILKSGAKWSMCFALGKLNDGSSSSSSSCGSSSAAVLFFGVDVWLWRCWWHTIHYSKKRLAIFDQQQQQQQQQHYYLLQ